MAPQEIALPKNFDGQTRLFPLSDLVFFPSTVLPLHIFESRYCEMLEDALQGDQLISMATLLPGFEHDYYCRPPIAPVVCIGQIASCTKTEKGTYDLILIGLQRAEVAHEIEPVRSFRRAHVNLIDERVSTAAEEMKQTEEALISRLLAAMPAAQPLVDEFRGSRISFATLTDVAAFHLPLPTDLKLQLLSEPDVFVRCQNLLTNLPAPRADGDSDSPSYLHDFGRN